MSAPSRLVSIRHKVERAEKHILDLDHALHAFLDSGPYEIIRENKPDTGELAFRVTKVEDTAAGIMLIAGDALNNLRSALDYLVWQLIEANGQTPLPHQSGYPIFKDEKGYVAGKDRKIEGVSPIAANVFDATKPYQGGNNEFWILHELNNIDKHRQLIGTGWVFKNVKFAPSDVRAFTSGYQFTTTAGILQPVGPPSRLKTGDILHTTKVNVSEEVKFIPAVAFDEPSVLQGQAVLETVKKLFDLVNKTTLQFAALL